MNKNIEHYVFHKENFLEESYCENYIDELSVGTWEKHSWYDNNKNLTIQPYEEDTELDVLSSPFNIFIYKKIHDFIVDSLYSTISEYVEIFKFDKYFIISK